MDPKYLYTNQLTEKRDVYSLGVVLMELLTGKQSRSFNSLEEERSLANYFLSSLKDNKLFEVFGSHIVNEGNMKELKKLPSYQKVA